MAKFKLVFDTKVFVSTAIEVEAETLAEARKAGMMWIDRVVDVMNVTPLTVTGMNDAHPEGAKLIEVTLGEDGTELMEVEKDGDDVYEFTP